MTSSNKPYDLVLYGATGFTGRLCAKELKTSAGKVKWAIGGRSQKKLDELKRELGLDVDVVVADSFDVGAVQNMVKSCRCVISLVGPYHLYGDLLYKACAENGVHYVDLSGEIGFNLRMITEHGAAAAQSGAICINSCGFDSIPSDLCTYLAAKELKRVKPSAQIGYVESAFKVKGGFSGGTLTTGLLDYDRPAEEKKRLNSNPYILSPVGRQKGQKRVVKSAFAAKLVGAGHGGFFIMAHFNTRIVFRTFGILENMAQSNSDQLSYGPHFQYGEYLRHDSAVSSTLVTSMFALVGLLMSLSPIRWLIRKYGMQPGEGPSEEAQKTGYFKTVTTATEHEGDGRATCTMYGQGDPGYSATAVMITTCGLALLQDFDRLPAHARRGGALTPATAFGEVIKERLEQTGRFRFETSSSVNGAEQQRLQHEESTQKSARTQAKL